MGVGLIFWVSSQLKGYRGIQSMGGYEAHRGYLWEWEHIAELNFWMSNRLWEWEQLIKRMARYAEQNGRI